MSIVTRFRAALAALLLLAGAAAADTPPGPGLELVMVEEHGCIWCARWNEEVGPAYGKTPESAAAPLRRILIGDPLPPDLSFDSRAVFTPTFVLVRDGAEIGRIEGYPGPDFFWPLLESIVRKALAEPASETGAGADAIDTEINDQKGEGS